MCICNSKHVEEEEKLELGREGVPEEREASVAALDLIIKGDEGCGVLEDGT